MGIAGLVAGASIGAFTRIVTEAADFGAALVEVSAVAGTTVEQLQELRRAFGEDGAAADIVDRSIIKLNTSLSRAAQGTEGYAEIFARLGVEATDGAGAIRSASDVLDELAGRIDANNFRQYQADLALVFGERGLQALSAALLRSGDAFDAARARAADFGVVTAGQAASLKDLSQTLADLSQTFKTQLAVAVSENVQGLQDFLNVLITTVSFIGNVGSFLSGNIDIFGNLTERGMAAAAAAAETAVQFELVRQNAAAAAAEVANVAVQAQRASTVLPSITVDLDLPDFTSDVIDTSGFERLSATYAGVAQAARDVGDAHLYALPLLTELGEEARLRAGIIADAYRQMGFSVSDALFGIISGGREANDVLRELLANLVRALASGLLAAAGSGSGNPFLQGFLGGFQTGGVIPGPGFALVGERGAELIQTRGGERIFNARDTQRMLGGGGLTINVEAGVNEAAVRRVIQEEAAYIQADVLSSVNRRRGSMRNAIRSAAR